MNTCVTEHNKIYANYLLSSHPPKYPWICSKCGTTGIDDGWVGYNPGITYEEVITKFRRESNG